jgi:microcystin-dependent protein
MDPYIGEIRLFGGPFAPTGWKLCDGSLLPISSYTPLFSIIGNRFGGDGKTTFALPTLSGKTMLGAGNAPNLTARPWASSGGSPTVTLGVSQMPAHNHNANCMKTQSIGQVAENAVWANGPLRGTNLYYADAVNQAMNPQALLVAGNGQPHENMQPYLALSFIIALDGIYPAKSA